MDTKTYEQKMEQMVEDRATYEISRKDPTEEKKRTLKTLLKPLLETGKITRDGNDTHT